MKMPPVVGYGYFLESSNAERDQFFMQLFSAENYCCELSHVTTLPLW